jgi:hypothetical protein
MEFPASDDRVRSEEERCTGMHANGSYRGVGYYGNLNEEGTVEDTIKKN